MSWKTLLPGAALMLATACGGGGDESPTGTANPGQGGNTAELQLLSLGFAGLPADAAVEDCKLTRFYSGVLDVDRAGNWEITLQVHDDTGDWGYQDRGSLEQDGNTVWCDSDIAYQSYRGTPDGTEMKIMYDWCANGVPDIQLVFGQ